MVVVALLLFLLLIHVSQPDSGPSPQPAGKTPAAAAAHPARREDGQPGGGGKRSSRGSSRSSQRGAGTPAAAGTVASSASPSSGRGASLGLLLAMATGGPADSLLTRDADTVAEYIGLMSDEALLENRDSASSKRWSQVRVCVRVFLPLARNFRTREKGAEYL